jgi:drug/metabolite transporter (DMT)-like permease
VLAYANVQALSVVRKPIVTPAECAIHNVDTAVNDQTKGYVLGMAAVIIFGLTLPATRIAVTELPATFVGLGRAVVAAAIAALFLKFGNAPRPSRAQLGKLALASAGIIFGFPLFSAIAMKTAPAAHGGVVLGILPLATATAGVIFARERPSLGFWLCAAAGATAIVTFSLLDGGAEIHAADALLILAVLSAAIGYAISGDLSRTLGGWQVISWALVISVPALLVPVIWVLPEVTWSASPGAWLGFAYVAIFSQFLGFFFWNRAMAIAGVGRIGQLQLFQIFVTLIGSWALIGEEVKPITILFATIVFLTVWLGRTMPVHRT